MEIQPTFPAIPNAGTDRHKADDLLRLMENSKLFSNGEIQVWRQKFEIATEIDLELIFEFYRLAILEKVEDSRIDKVLRWVYDFLEYELKISDPCKFLIDASENQDARRLSRRSMQSLLREINQLLDLGTIDCHNVQKIYLHLQDFLSKKHWMTSRTYYLNATAQHGYIPQLDHLVGKFKLAEGAQAQLTLLGEIADLVKKCEPDFRK